MKISGDCPECGFNVESRPNLLNDYYYDIKGKQYPIQHNRHSGSNGNGDWDDWDEEHVCYECNTTFIFANGIY